MTSIPLRALQYRCSNRAALAQHDDREQAEGKGGEAQVNVVMIGLFVLGEQVPAQALMQLH